VLRGLARTGPPCAGARRGDPPRGAQRLRELADKPEGYPKALALYELSRIQQQAGRTQDANQTLQQLGKEFPDSPLAADMRAAAPPSEPSPAAPGQPSQPAETPQP